MTAVRRPVLRYYGGKWKIAPWLISKFPPHKIYVEPFGGGASVLLRKPRSYGEVYNDLDGTVVNVFRVLRDQPKDLERVLHLTPFSREEFELAMTAPQPEDPVERARRTIALSFMGFGPDSITRGCRTGFRRNSNRSGTTPAHDWVNYPYQVELFAQRLQGVIIENMDAKDVMTSQDSLNTLHYVDPPYVHATRHDQHGYTHEMTDGQHQELLTFLRQLKGMVIVSAYDHEIYWQLEAFGWKKLETSALAMGNRRRTEVLWLNTRAWEGQTQYSLDLK